MANTDWLFPAGVLTTRKRNPERVRYQPLIVTASATVARP
jgi:hypothetical protein